MDWNGKTVLITGAGGFIGSHLTERLVELGADTRAFVRYGSAGSWGWLDDSPKKNQIEVFQGDVRDRDTLKRAIQGSDVVFHLASLIAIPYSYHAPMSYVQVNVEGTTNVLQVARECGVQKVVHTSTSETYGTAQYVPINEDHPMQGQSPYSASKIGADKIAESFFLSFGLPVATIRPFNTYGPRQSTRAVIPTIITQALAGGSVKLGALTPTRDLNFVADTVEGFIKMAESERSAGETINVGAGREISIGDLADLIFEIVGQKAQIIQEDVRMRPENSEVERLLADNSKARELLGWEPKYSLRDGLTETIRWMEKNIERYRLGVYTV